MSSRALTAARLSYAALFAAAGASYPYLSVFYQDRGLDLAATSVMDVAHTGLVRCPPSATVREGALLMMTEYVRHLLVEDDGELVGVVSARDLLGAYVNEPT